jgi:hypothetical protein
MESLTPRPELENTRKLHRTPIHLSTEDLKGDEVGNE